MRALVLARVAVRAPRRVRVQGRHPEAGLLGLGLQRGDPGGLALGLGLSQGLVLAGARRSEGLRLKSEAQQPAAQEPSRFPPHLLVNLSGPEAQKGRPRDPRAGPALTKALLR